jgi:hypothetical protein
VRPERLELPTLGSEDQCSIQLSYGRIVELLAKRLSRLFGLCQTGLSPSKRSDCARLIERPIQLVEVTQAAFEDRLEGPNIFRMQR